jgi:uncharacterized protein (DUF1330 family)
MIALYPKPEQIQTLLTGPADQPVVMLNLLRFKERAGDPDAGLTGEAAYQRYVDEMVPFVVSKGGRVIWSGRVDSQVIGDGGEGFHVAALMEYPSRKVFVEIATSSEVSAIGVHRSAGLEGQWLLATTTREESKEADEVGRRAASQGRAEPGIRARAISEREGPES